jgi:hypothetical protein
MKKAATTSSALVQLGRVIGEWLLSISLQMGLIKQPTNGAIGFFCMRAT